MLCREMAKRCIVSQLDKCMVRVKGYSVFVFKRISVNWKGKRGKHVYYILYYTTNQTLNMDIPINKRD